MNTTHQGLAALERAIEICEGQSNLARELAERTGEVVKQGNIWSWLHRSKKVPPEMAPYIELITADRGHVVTRRELCPEFPWDIPAQGVKATRRRAG